MDNYVILHHEYVFGFVSNFCGLKLFNVL